MPLNENFNPYLVMMLSQLGAGLDPQGVGGAIGRATNTTLQSMLVSRALSQQDKLNKALISALIGHLANPQSGLTELSLSDKGITLKGTAPKVKEPSLLKSNSLKGLSGFLEGSPEDYLKNSPYDLL